MENDERSLNYQDIPWKHWVFRDEEHQLSASVKRQKKNQSLQLNNIKHSTRPQAAQLEQKARNIATVRIE